MFLRHTVPATAVTSVAVLFLGTLTGCKNSTASQPAPVPVRTSTSGQVSTSAGSSGFAYLNLYPFQGAGDAQAWEAAYRSGGQAPWHLDPDLTALSFTQGFLGFQGVDSVTSHQVSGADAHIGVGFKLPNGTPSTAAVLHLRKIGTDADAPWEVVGSADTTLTITQPAYGSHVTAHVTAGGQITGVDESLHTWVREVSTSQALGDTCCVPAGGDKSPWTTGVSFKGAADHVLTVAVATGGHVASVERFAVTGVQTP